MNAFHSLKLPSRRWLIFPPLMLGIAVLAFAINQRQAPERVELAEVPRPLSVMTIREQTVIPMVVGYGVVSPARTWRAIAEVDGQVLQTYSRLDPGEIVEAGTVLVVIDPTDLQLQLQRLQAQEAALAAQIDEVKAMRENDNALLAIEKRSLELSDNEIQRSKSLIERRAISQASYDQLEREHLLQKRQVQNLENSINLYPSKIARLTSEEQGVKKQIEEANRELARTTIKVPFRSRLSSVQIEPGQYVGPGETLFEVHGLDAVEIEARIPINELRILSPTNKVPAGSIPASAIDGIGAVVRIRSGDWSHEWPANVIRIREQVQRTTRTLGIVVQVDRTGKESATSDEPLLLDGMFCEVELRGRPRPNEIVIPRSAIHDGHVFIVNAEDRLESRELTSILHLDDLAIIGGDIQKGERIILSDPTPAVLGMLVHPVEVERENPPSIAATP